jgi:pyroglutamyl-peptidase
MELLLTGFEPFGGSFVNPSQQIVSALDGKTIFGIKIKGMVLPVDNQKGPAGLIKALKTDAYDCVLSLGEASRRPAISIERVAVNLMDYRIPDNSGKMLVDTPVQSNGPAAYFSTLPVRAIQERLMAERIPAELSLSAGTYLCNQVFYALLHHLATSNSSASAGFIHLPSLPEQVTNSGMVIPSMSFETSLKGIELSIEVISRWLKKKKDFGGIDETFPG